MHLNRSPSSPSDKQFGHYPFGLKFVIYLNKQVFTVYSDSNNDSVIRINGNNCKFTITEVDHIKLNIFRMHSSEIHLLVSFCNLGNDSTSLNAWVNGQAVTWSTSSGPNGVNWLFNSTNNHQIGLQILFCG